MPEFETTVSFEVFCGDCGVGLCGQTSVRGMDITVNACSNCVEIAREEGRTEGYAEAEKVRED